MLSQKLAILISIPGIAEATAFAMLIEMPELGSLDGKQAASLAGLAPISRQSGKWQGHERIQGGRTFLRRAIYMPALAAVRFNRDLKAKFDQLIAAGKPAKVALVAIMRKLIVEGEGAVPIVSETAREACGAPSGVSLVMIGNPPQMSPSLMYSASR